MAGAARTGLPDVARGLTDAAAAVPLVAEHDTWITVDPLVGCPANCTYCYLGAMGLRTVRPRRRATPAAVSAALAEYLNGRRASIVDPATDWTPICLGNYTDMMIAAAGRRGLVDYLEAIIDVLRGRRQIVVVTKGTLDADVVAAVDALGWPILWMFSQSMSELSGSRLEFGPVADLDTTLSNARLVSASAHQRCVHFWRPLVPELRPSPERSRKLIDRLRGAGFTCSVVQGLKRAAVEDHRLKDVLRQSFARVTDGSDVFDDEHWLRLREFARRVGYPLYRNTSCAIAYASGAPERLGTWRSQFASRLCHPTSCPPRQRRRCAPRATDEADADLRGRVCEFLGLAPDRVTVDRAAGTLRIDAQVDEGDFNVLMHGLAWRWDVRPHSVRREKAWLGVFAGRFSG